MGLLVAGFLVGRQLWTEGGVPPTPTREREDQPLRVLDIPDSLVRIGPGIATYRNVTVQTVPGVDEAEMELWMELGADGGADWLAEIVEQPHALGRWSRLTRAFYERTAALVETKERAVPVRVRPFQIMLYEVTCSQYAEFLRAVMKKPRLLSQYPWVTSLWRPRDDPDDPARANAYGYQGLWWQRIEEHHREELGRTVEAPAWLDLDPAKGPPSLSDQDAVMLLIPPHWVDIDEKGRMTWDIPPWSHNLPVTDVSWWDAHMFAHWAGDVLGMKLRLPFGAEWMRVFHGNHPARPADDFDDTVEPGRRWPWGNDFDPHACNNINRSELEKKPVKLRDVRKRYGWHEGKTVDGVLNMAGNAAEWVDNWVAEYPDGRPGSGMLEAFAWEFYEPPTEAPRGAAIKNAYTAGGSYLKGIDDCSVTFNRQEDKRARRIDVGFRLALDEVKVAR